MASTRYDEAIKLALQPLEKLGLLKEHKTALGSQASILVHPQGADRPLVPAKAHEVPIDKVKGAFKERLEAALNIKASMAENAVVVAKLTNDWLDSRLPVT